jgi:putative PIN family toxin of toxin-antitoxin system
VTRAVIDTNVLASAVLRIRGDSPPVRLIDMWLAQRFELIVSDHIIGELVKTLDSTYFSTRVSIRNRSVFLANLDALATIAPLLRVVEGIATQPADDLVLAAALNSNADYLVTGDRALLALGTFEGTRIVSAADFIAMLDT